MSYWSERERELEAPFWKKAKATENYLADKYSFALKNLKKELAVFYSEFETEQGVSYQDSRQHLTDTELKDFKENIDLILTKLKDTNDKAYINKVKTYVARTKVQRLESLNVLLEQHVVKLSDTNQKAVTNLLKTSVSSKYESTFKDIVKVEGLRDEFSNLPATAVEVIMTTPWSGASYSDRIWLNKDQLAQNLQQELVKGLIQGDSYRTIAARVAKATNSSNNRANTLVRTELAYVMQQANKRIYNDLGVKEYEYSAIVDARTSAICLRLNGKRFAVEDAIPGVNMPPMHPNCRSIMLPIF